MPTIPSISTSVENQHTQVLDSHAKAGEFQKDSRGRLIKHSGGFSVVYPYIVKSGEKWAFRCWHSDLGNVRRRFETISSVIQQARLPFLCDFIYVDKGICVEGTVYSTTRMRWVNGITIKRYICTNFNSQSKLLDIASQFLKLIKKMHTNSLAHGDLQHDNILVGDDGKIYLVDYDSFYCPQLKGCTDIIRGLDDYQHPSRKINKESSEKIDYFSELIIYLSILGIAHQPQLADKYKIEGTEALLFQAKDFVNITESPIYKDLVSLGEEFHILLKVLEIYLEKTSIDQLEPFYEVFDRISKQPVITDFKCMNGNTVYFGDLLHFEWDVHDASLLYFNEHNISSSNGIQVTAENICEFQLKAVNYNKLVVEKLKINILPKPKISFTTKATKLRKGKDVAVLHWSITDATSVRLFANDVEIPIYENININKTTFANSVCYKIEEHARYELVVKGLDRNREFHKYLDISVHEESKLHYFYTDKQFSFPGIPVTLSWKIDRAKDIVLSEIGKIEREGSVIVTPDKSTLYRLTYSDLFGKYESSVEVKMLPIPLITAVVIPTPLIEYNSEIYISMPIFNDLNYRPVIEPTSIDLNPLFDNELFDIEANMPTPELDFNTTVSFIEPKFQLQKINFGKRLTYALRRLKITNKQL